MIEPAFGVGRIFTAILEHNFHMRDKKRTFLHLPPKIAPIKCSILPVMSHEKFDDAIHKLSNQSITRRYADHQFSSNA